MQNTVQRVQAEWRKALRQLIDTKRQTLQAQRNAGVIPEEGFLKAELELLTLERQAAQSKAERITALEKLVRQARMLEDAVKSEVQSGVGSSLTIQEARVRTLEYQVALEEEKAAR